MVYFAFLLCAGGAWANPSSRPPTARAGSEQTVAQGASITLNGSASSDPDGHPLIFMWTLASKPDGSEAVLLNPASVNPTFVADKPGSYTINLIVNDGTANSVPDSVAVSTSNSAPVADAGPNQTVQAPGLVALNGSGSTDVDGNALTFAWEFVKAPGRQHCD